MKKFLFILLPLLSFCFFLAQSSFALGNVANPAPPIGIPCGNTICLTGEVCKTTGSQQHCVPTSINSTDLPDCNSVPSGGADQGTFPPNIKCWNHFSSTQTDLTLYKKTCIYEPIASYEDKRTLHDGNQPFSKCGKGPSGNDTNAPVAPGGNDPACDVHMLVDTDVKAAQMGGYGPDEAALDQYSVDFLAQNYLYNSLFDRPSDLNEVSPTKNADGYSIKNREAYRTYWRLLPASNQANLRSFVMNMASDKQISNIHFNYTDHQGRPRDTDFIKLYNALKTQVILFWHFPFVRVGCLTRYPICPEYAQAIAELKPDFHTLRALADLIGIRPLVETYISVYETALSIFDLDLTAPYEAFVPLDFDSVRGYILKKKDDIEQAAYDQYSVLQKDLANGFDSFRLTNVSAENLPYIGAIYQGLLSPKFGLLPSLEPQWLIDKYSMPGATLISDYQMGNRLKDFPEVKIYRKNFFDQLQEETAALLTDPWGWLQKKLLSFFDPASDKLKGYTDHNVDNLKNDIVEQYANMQMCPMPVSYHLLSPKTATNYIDPTTGEIGRPDDHHQIITIPGNQLDWSYAPKCATITPDCKADPLTGVIKCTSGCHITDETYIDGDQCCTRAWSVSGTKHGKALTVLNNPKQTDIKQAVAGNDNISFYKMLLPDGVKKVTDANIDAPIAKHLDTQSVGLITAPNGKGSVLNPAESILRENNLAQDSMHYLQNCWTVPKDLQNSPRCTPTPILAPAIGVNSCETNVTDAQVIAATQTMAEKYGIPAKWLEGMWKLEGGATQMGENCKELNLYKVMGPMQIATGTYKLVTCDNERFPNADAEREKCSDNTKLSRCSLEGSLELAARVILQKLNAYGAYSGSYACGATKSTASLSSLFRAVNAYGACAIVPGTNKSYAQWVCEYAGNCPSPLPPAGAPLTCVGN